ncbi:MAG TPA: hypothetical protein VNV38_00120 [Stellaceae bacterium]|jgi:hypothetical protein|nr:hypothetical protein [Stellaceae bacterium]
MRQQLARSLSGPIRLWLVVVVLWAGATLFRTNRFWAPDSNPAESWGNPWVWIDLFVPPILFAAMLIALQTISRLVSELFHRPRGR